MAGSLIKKIIKMSKQVSNKAQLAKLVELMEHDKHLAKNICSKPAAKQGWEQVAIVLNNLGPPFKPAEKWTRVWIDMKAKVKKKLSENRASLRATGGGPNILHSFSPLESAVEQILELDRNVNPPGTEFGLSNEKISGTATLHENAHHHSHETTFDKVLITDMTSSSLNAFSVASETMVIDDQMPYTINTSTLTEIPTLISSSRSKAHQTTQSLSASALSEMPSSSQSTRSKTKQGDRMFLLKEQTSSQQSFYEEMLKKMDGLVDTLNEIKSQQKEFFREFVELKTEELKIAKAIKE